MLKKGESDIYLTHVCRPPQGVGSPETDKKQELSVNMVPFISCRCRLTIWLADAARVEKGSGGEGGQVRLLDVNTRRLSRLKYKLVYKFILLEASSLFVL